MKKITFLLILLGWSSFLSAQCLSAVNGQYPFGAAYSATTCDGTTENVITPYGFASEYSLVNVTSGETYVFSSSILSDYITISDEAGTNAIVFGENGSLTWVSDITGVIRFYTHLNVNCAAQSASRVRGIVCGTPPTCAKPVNVLVDGITTTAANFTWDAVGIETNWEVLIILNGDPAPDSATTGISVSGTSAYLADNLTQSSVYQFYVRSSCGGGDFSTWTAATSFVTSCTAISTLPWEENFDNLAIGTNIFPPCWAYTNSLNTWSISNSTFPSSAYSGTNSLRRTWNTNGWAFTPLVSMNAGTSYTLTYFLRTNDATIGYDINLSVGNGQTESDMTENLSTVTSYQGPIWTKFTFPFTPTITGDFSFGIHVVAPFAPNGIDFDNFKIDLTPSCIEPTELVATNVAESTATVSWMASITTPTNGYEYYLSEDITNPTITSIPTGTVIAGILMNDFTALTANTTYYVWVRSACGALATSEWSTKVMFKTLCTASTNLFENFDASTNIPDCWNKVGTLGNVSVSAFNNGFSAPNNMSLSSNNTTDLATVALPPLGNAMAGTHHLKFKARSQYTWSVGGMVEVGYLTNANDAASFVMLESFTTTSGTVYDTFTANLGTQPQSQILAMRNPGTPTNGVVIDDVSWAPIPTTAPNCATVTATPNATCGNFATILTWNLVDGVDGYYLSLGTTAGGTDIINNESIGDVNTYSYTGSFNTTYFYTLTPFNAFGSATGCVEQSFATFVDGCVCASYPISNDNNGITNVQLGNVDFPNGDVVYADYTSTPVDLGQGLSTNLQVSFATGFTYDTNIWIDFNNDLNFDDSEIVISGNSPQPNPSNLDLTFTMPADAALGVHRMRLGSADFGQVPPNPCFSGSYGVTIDFSVNIVVPTCTPASVVTSSVIDDCANNQYFVAVEIESLGNGTPSITDGITNYPILAVGTIQIGPFTSGTSTSLVLLHGTESICNLPLGNFSSICPPINDSLCNAILLAIGADSAGDAFTSFGATAETSETAAACFNSGINGSLWFSFVAPVSGEVSVTTDIPGGTLTDTEIAVYAASGVTCSDLSTLGNAIGCDQDGGIIVNFNSIVNLTTLISGDTYFVQVDRWGTATAGTFGINVIDTNPLSTNSFNDKNFTYYPNPVKDVLNLSYTKNISNITVFNLLGQQIDTKIVNSNQSKVDMSNLATGTYLVKVTSDTQVKIIKVIKQ